MGAHDIVALSATSNDARRKFLFSMEKFRRETCRLGKASGKVMSELIKAKIVFAPTLLPSNNALAGVSFTSVRM